ncbi:MAG: murein biosynthesis integral membrane protein MurJ [Gammaproteobacteria bacterium]|nr:murein biosynthesis integral membrane protein MurJ [Gammaproteobacteria bacterium]
MTDDEAAPHQSETTSLTGKGLVVASLTGMSRVGGLARDVVVSYFLGAGPIADAFFIAFKIPNFFRRLFAEGAFQQAFIPVLADYRENNTQSDLIDFVRTVAGSFAVVLLGLSFVGVVLAQPLIDLFTLRNWVGEPRYQAAIDMLRVMFPYLGLISLTAFAGSVLNSYQRFSITAGAPLLLSVCVIVAAVWAAMLSGHVAYAMAWGVLTAGFLQLLVHIPSLRRLGLLQWPRVNFRDEGVRRILKLIIPGVYAASAGQINILVGTILCAQLTVGTVSWFYYADRLIQLPMALLAIAMQTILLPNLSRLHRKGDRELFSETLDWGVRIGVLLGLPATVALYYLAKPILATVFLRGAFEVADVEMTAVALQAFAIGLVPMVLTRVLGPGYFSREDMHTPFVYATIGVGVNIAISLSLFWWLGLLGIAFATTVAAFVNCYLLMRGLILGGQYHPQRSLWRFGIASFVGCVVMVACLVWLNFDFETWASVSEIRRVGQMALMVVCGIGVYSATLLICGVRPQHLIHRV